MTHPCSEAFPVTDVEDFAKHLGLDGTDADMFYESYYNLNIDDWTWEEELETENNWFLRDLLSRSLFYCYNVSDTFEMAWTKLSLTTITSFGVFVQLLLWLCVALSHTPTMN